MIHNGIIDSKRCTCILCDAQDKKMHELAIDGYRWNQQLSLSACAVVWTKNNDLWVFGLDGSILNTNKSEFTENVIMLNGC